MTKTLYDPEVERKGEVKGVTKTVLLQLNQKFKEIPEEYAKRISSLPIEKVNLIAKDIFIIDRVIDLDKYIN